ncbi:hypothetical protein ACWDNI_35935 [Nocardia niigatensis]
MSAHVATKEAGLNLQDLADTLSGLGIGGGIGAVVTGIFSRRRHRVDALEKLEGIATRLAENATRAAEARVSAMENQLVEYKEADRAREARRRRVAAAHTKWDQQVAQSLRDLGVDVTPPPSLEVV